MIPYTATRQQKKKSGRTADILTGLCSGGFEKIRAAILFSYDGIAMFILHLPFFEIGSLLKKVFKMNIHITI